MSQFESSFISVARRGSATGAADGAVVWVRGEHDLATKAALAVAIARAARLDDGDLLVDLSGVTFMDASTIGAIVGSASGLRSRSQSLAVRAPSPQALRVLDLCGLSHLVHPVLEAAGHPSGVAAALSTWVDVPPSDPVPRPYDGDASTRRRDARQPAESLFATIDAEADRGHP